MPQSEECFTPDRATSAVFRQGVSRQTLSSRARDNDIASSFAPQEYRERRISLSFGKVVPFRDEGVERNDPQIRRRRGHCMPYASGESPTAGDTVKRQSGKVGTVFELDLQANQTATNVEDKKVKFDEGTSEVDSARECDFVRRASEQR
jgi:hypothetical protein